MNLNFNLGSICSTVSSCDVLKSSAFILSRFEDLDLMIPVVSFQFRIFYDSIIY